ncbi:BlaI/MecI/CopY family transcriptional regulator [Lachnospiraceae bacterium OttesenSCG-928-D06]|nr:BlaI/MecI/CopY family transcriptional regulator [Lachnospiraceae bacterium OttesenSCG-928-D06]
MDLSNKISEAELEVMKILWREKQPVLFSDIRTELNQKMGWEKSTIATLLRRLKDKNVISVQGQRIYYYTPNITKEEYTKEKEKSLIDKLYEGSAKKFVTALCHRGELTEADIDELKSYFQMKDID